MAIYGVCWVAYFDILGFTKQIDEHKGHIDSFVRCIYDRTLEEIQERSGRISKALDSVSYAWFSDTFILFTKDATFGSYSSLDIAAWEFFQIMSVRKYPLSGALSVGEFYADKEKDTYVGPALIEAHLYANKLNWIGFVLTPEARKKLSEPGYTINELDYVEYKVPIKPEKEKNGEKLFARKIHCLKDYIIQMQNSAKGEGAAKYDNTLKFIDKHSLTP